VKKTGGGQRPREGRERRRVVKLRGPEKQVGGKEVRSGGAGKRIKRKKKRVRES